jgi:hypothetical protein
MPKRKGKKPPKRHPADMAPKLRIEPTKLNGRVFYTDDQRRRLRNRLIGIVGPEQNIQLYIAAMERAGIAYDVAQLRRKLRRAGIYPPRVDNPRDAYQACFCPDCGGRRSHPAYYNKGGLSEDARAAKQIIDVEALTEAEREDREEFDKLGGNSPGILVQIHRQSIGRSRQQKHERAA